MRPLIVLALVLAACSKPASKQQPASNQQPASVPAPAAAAASPGRSPSQPDGGACVDGWRATMSGWLGTGYETIAIDCKHFRAILIVDTVDEDEDVDAGKPVAYILPRETWALVWKRLEDGHWRDLTGACADNDNEGRGTDYVGVTLEITDGTVTKTVSCAALTAQHAILVDAFVEANEQAVKWAKAQAGS